MKVVLSIVTELWFTNSAPPTSAPLFSNMLSLMLIMLCVAITAPPTLALSLKLYGTPRMFTSTSMLVSVPFVLDRKALPVICAVVLTSFNAVPQLS